MPLPGYVGDQRGYTTPGQHQALAGLAGQAADSSMSAYVQRIDFSLDQIGHNKYHKVLQSHNNFALGRRLAGMTAEEQRAYHNKFF